MVFVGRVPGALIFGNGFFDRFFGWLSGKSRRFFFLSLFLCWHRLFVNGRFPENPRQYCEDIDQ